MSTEKELKEKLRFEKLLVFAKSEKYKKNFMAKEYGLAMIELAYSYKCNLKCEHCYASYLGGGKKKLSIDDVKKLSRQADEIGIFQFNLQGGEPLIWKDLDQVIVALEPDKFHITITTNATKLDFESAKHLRTLGVDKIAVSLDSFNESEFETIRKSNGLYKKTIDALFSAKEAGLHVNINTVITRQNVRSPEVVAMAEFAETHGFTLFCLVAVPVGRWEGKYDKLLNGDDTQYLKQLSKEYPVIRRDVYPAYGIDHGCRTMNGLVYITENGDLLSCPFIHVSIGNILDEPLGDILRRGWQVKYFRDYNNKCLAGEDTTFIKNILSKTFGKKVPIPFREAFADDDLYKE